MVRTYVVRIVYNAHAGVMEAENSITLTIYKKQKIFSEKQKGFRDGLSYSTPQKSKETRANAITQPRSPSIGYLNHHVKKGSMIGGGDDGPGSEPIPLNSKLWCFFLFPLIIFTGKCTTLWGEPDRVHVQNMEQLHAFDCHQNVAEPQATAKSHKIYTHVHRNCESGLVIIYKHAAHWLVQHRL